MSKPDASPAVQRIANNNQTLAERSTDITPESLKEMYPTDEWVGRFYDAISN